MAALGRVDGLACLEAPWRWVFILTLCFFALVGRAGCSWRLQ
jgi:uncharacterized membrane protein YqjE